MGSPGGTPVLEPASLVIVDPNGHRTRAPIEPLPFRIGRQPDNNLVLRDSRISRSHARIVAEDGSYVLEDSGSRHGTFVNGARISRQALRNSDRIEFGSGESFSLIFALDGAELKRLMEQMAPPDKPTPPGVGSNLGKLRAVLDLARSLESSFSIDEVLAQVVDTALAVTGAERGFLLLRSTEGLQMRVARHRKGHKLHENELRVPRGVIHRALERRRELLHMNFEPTSSEMQFGTIADLDLRSVVCVPLVRIRAGQADTTSIMSSGDSTIGVLYMDSRLMAADLAGGNRELLQTLAIEASTVLENARLLEEERAKQQMEEELKLARTIQQSLLPSSLPSTGWLRASGSSVASHQVGGDYFDIARVTSHCWSAVVADVSGKGVSSALLASLLEGALIAASDQAAVLGRRMERLNKFLLERTAGEKYATVFYALLHADGKLSYVNAAHCPPILARAGADLAELDATGMPVGLVDGATFEVAQCQLAPGDKLIVYSDGVTEAQDPSGAFFGKKRLYDLATGHASGTCAQIHDAIQRALATFTEGAAQSDDITLVVLEYAGGLVGQIP
ncbi:MAG TPA: SpoIIE family protein phosphatase [Bryobacteraceae bacterium]|nr:SpoIIE family protein phosphatase [Bryobacteraceae bacterium]